jgi:hypothetical protein
MENPHLFSSDPSKWLKSLRELSDFELMPMALDGVECDCQSCLCCTAYQVMAERNIEVVKL